MALAGVDTSAGRTSAAALARVASHPATWVAVATLLLLAGYVAAQGPSLAAWLGDTDDAVRLVSVRELITGASWFDTTLPRIGAPEPLVSHWSRLVDAPLAAMMLALQPLLGTDAAELAVRAIWPVLLFAGLAFIVARAGQRQGGPWAAAFAVLLAATSAIAITQFRPGRVDHHNVQILCAVGGVILLSQAFRVPRAGWAAGALIGLGLAVGYEAIALVVPVLVLAAACALLWPAGGRGLVHAIIATAATMLVALLATTAPSQLLHIHCDALSLNLVVLATAAAAGVWAAVALPVGTVTRLAIGGTCAGLGALMYAVLEPACLAGPFGQVNPALKPIWLDHVAETRSVFTLIGLTPSLALAQFLFAVAGAAAGVLLWHRRRDRETALLAAAMVLAAPLGCWQIKLMPYAAWLAVLPLAICAAELKGTASVSAPIVRIAAALFVSQAMLTTILDGVLAPFTNAAQASATDTDGNLTAACYRNENVRRLGNLPPGLVAADIDLGPYIVALTPHRVVAAPYHRLDQGILAATAIRSGSIEEAGRHLARLGVDYFATCADQKATSTTTFRAQLLSGAKIPGLEEVATGAAPAIRVWRVVR